ncbi:MAG: hypothetical protein LBG77_03045 [Dysgonamonadaceae bacterium]|nr:hypothetical protein [Dysgonamonadaceae bacterium]
MRDINSIAEDADGNLWIGTNEKGLCIYNPRTRENKAYLYNQLRSENNC